MSSMTVRKIEERVKAKLRIQAARNGRSMEEEVRTIITRAVDEPAAPVRGNLADGIAAIFDPLGGVELDIPPRGPGREPPDFSGPDFER